MKHQDRQENHETAKGTITGQGTLSGSLTVEKANDSIPRIAIIQRRQQVQYFVEKLGNAVELEMVQIPGGSFVMGEQGRDRKDSRHRVEVPSFCMGKYPVTQAQYQAIMGNNPSRFKGANCPVERVTWHDAIAFCETLSHQTGRRYRLPSEAEWEYACRAGTTTRYHVGEVIAPELANYGGHQKQTTPVGSFGIANAFGLYDMHGNIWEWCADHWHTNYEGAPTDGRARIDGGDADRRVLRGGSWNVNPENCRSADRNRNDTVSRYNNIGFRVVCSTLREG